MADYFSMFIKYLPRLLGGLRMTILIAIFGLLIAVILGVFLCILSISGKKVLVKIANFYITIIRGTPLMILALFLYFGVIKDSLPLVMSASLILGLNASAFMAEIFRAGIRMWIDQQREISRRLKSIPMRQSFTSSSSRR